MKQGNFLVIKENIFGGSTWRLFHTRKDMNKYIFLHSLYGCTFDITERTI